MSQECKNPGCLELKSKYKSIAEVLSSIQNREPDLVLMPNKVCGHCDTDMGVHKENCPNEALRLTKQMLAKQLLLKCNPTDVDDLVSLLTTVRGNSLGGSIFRMVNDAVDRLETIRSGLRLEIIYIDEVIKNYKQDVERIQEHWCRMDEILGHVDMTFEECEHCQGMLTSDGLDGLICDGCGRKFDRWKPAQDSD